MFNTISYACKLLRERKRLYLFTYQKMSTAKRAFAQLLLLTGGSILPTSKPIKEMSGGVASQSFKPPTTVEYMNLNYAKSSP